MHSLCWHLNRSFSVIPALIRCDKGLPITVNLVLGI